MFDALSLTNSYVIKEFNIKRIKAGIHPSNQRSKKLIHRLSFKNTGYNDEMEINGKLEQIDLYLLTC